jgi:trimethylamine:corrinoid methyltransferase-like protein
MDMFKRKKEIGSKRGPTREEYANVTPIVDTRYSDTETEARALGVLEERMLKKIERAVDRFLQSPEIEDLAQFNDFVLRTYLKLPARLRATQSGRIFLI